MSKSEKIIIFDTTLRDGEQAAGATMKIEEKIAIATLLDEMGVDVIEAGFAVASEGDFKAVNEIAKNSKNAAICSLARAKELDIKKAGDALKPCAKGRIHTFISTSNIHLEYQLKMTKAQVLDEIRKSVTLARSLCGDVEWSGMDASRSDKDFLFKAIELAIDSGARTINIPDTVGYTIPDEYFALISEIKNNVSNIDKAILSVHCHNDLGLAVANSLSAVKAGARQIECTINGLGERAGNASLEELVMILKVRSNILPFYTDIKSEYIARISRLVSNATGFAVQKNKAIVGANAFAHESGIHQDGVLKNASTYEIMTPESVGFNKSSLVMGKHSGRHAFKDKLISLGYKDIENELLEKAFNEFKLLADRKKDIFDEDIISLVDSNFINENNKTKFVSLDIECGSQDDISKARIVIDSEGKEMTAETTGSGPVDAIFNAIRKLLPREGTTLTLYQVHSVTKGTDAQAEVTVRLSDKEGRIFSGHGAHTNTLVASAIAYINALNKLDASKKNDVEGISI